MVGALTLGGDIEYESNISLPEATQSPVGSAQQRALRALRNLVDRLTERGIRVMLVLDKVQDVAILEPLRRLITTPGVYTLITTSTHDFKRWQPDDLTRRVCYVPCLWGIAQEICNHLLRDRPERDSREVWALVNYLEFYGRGIPQRIIEMLKRFYIPSQRRIRGHLRNVQPLLYLPQDRLYEIMSIAHVQTILDWDRIFQDRYGRSMLAVWEPEELDEAKMGVYAILDWVLDKARRGERFSAGMLQEKGFSCGLPLDKAGIKLVINNLTEILKEAGAKTTTRGLDPTGLLYFDQHKNDTE